MNKETLNLEFQFYYGDNILEALNENHKIRINDLVFNRIPDHNYNGKFNIISFTDKIIDYIILKK